MEFWACKSFEDWARWAAADATRRADAIKKALRYRQIPAHKISGAVADMEFLRAVAADELKSIGEAA